MDIKLAKDVIKEKMAGVARHEQALYGVLNSMPAQKIDESLPPEVVRLQKEINQSHALLKVVIDSMNSSIELASEDLAEYFQSWGG